MSSASNGWFMCSLWCTKQHVSGYGICQAAKQAYVVRSGDSDISKLGRLSESVRSCQIYSKTMIYVYSDVFLHPALILVFGHSHQILLHLLLWQVVAASWLPASHQLWALFPAFGWFVCAGYCCINTGFGDIHWI